jgi:pimeloyl-ACP methyl ester carboxylesterase
MSKTIMLIHGAWLNSHSWEGFKARYEAQGYQVVAPDWPLDDRAPEDLRAAPNPALAKIGQVQIVDHLAAEIAKLSEAPILIGHSLGGVFVQHLLDRGLGVVGVSITPPRHRGCRLVPTRSCRPCRSSSTLLAARS